MYYHCIVFFDVQNLILCLTRELIKFIDYKIMLKLQCNATCNSGFVGKKIIKIDFGITLFKNVVLYEIYSKNLVTEYFLHVSGEASTAWPLLTTVTGI
jgi:hypothetical protein